MRFIGGVWLPGKLLKVGEASTVDPNGILGELPGALIF